MPDAPLRFRALSACPFCTCLLYTSGYRTKHEPCEALNRYANKLLNDPAAPVILEDPPALAVVSGDTSLGALLGSYQWQRKADGDSFENILSDSPHPLDCGELLSPLDTGEQTAVLRFAEAPDEILNARCWSEADLGSPDAVGQPVVCLLYTSSSAKRLSYSRT